MVNDMSTGYFIRRKPDIAKRKYLVELMRKDKTMRHIDEVTKIIDELYGEMVFSNEKNCLIGCELYIGRDTGGWKFLWKPHVYERVTFHLKREKTETGERCFPVYDEPTYYCFYGTLTRENIINKIMDDEYVLYNEYNEIQNKKEFLDMSLNSQGWDDESYFKEHPEEHRYYDMDRFTMLSKAGYDVEYGRGDFYSDGLRFAVYDF